MVAAPHTLATTTLTCPYPPHRTMLEVRGPTRAPPLVPKRVLPREVLGSTLWAFVPRHSFAHSLLLAASRVAIGPRAAPSVPCPKAAARTPGPRVASSASSRTLFGPSFPSHSLALPRPPLRSTLFVGLRFSLALSACPFRSPSSLALPARPPHSPPRARPLHSPSPLALPTRRGFLLLIPTGKQAIKGQFITLVKQGGIPATFLLSILVLKKRYHTIHYVGCVGVLLGIALVVAPSLADAPVDNWWYIIPLVLSTIPMAGSSVTQEIVLQVRVTLARGELHYTCMMFKCSEVCIQVRCNMTSFFALRPDAFAPPPVDPSSYSFLLSAGPGHGHLLLPVLGRIVPALLLPRLLPRVLFPREPRPQCRPVGTCARVAVLCGGGGAGGSACNGPYSHNARAPSTYSVM